MKTQKNFLADYYEKKPCLMTQALSGEVISWADVNDALYLGEQGSNGILLHKGGQFVDDRVYTELCSDIDRRRRTIKKDKLNDLVGDGASIIFNRMESVSLPIRNICQTIARYVGADTAANGYISIGGDQAFGNHWDTHDVFAVQLLGRKKWTIFEPTFELPLKDQRSGPHKNECPSTPVMEVTLEPGDVLYVPRGWWHSAEALKHEPTFHVAVGVHPTRVMDYVTWLCTEVFAEDVKLHENLIPSLHRILTLRRFALFRSLFAIGPHFFVILS